MIESIAELSMDLKTQEMYTAYSVSLTKKAMETEAASAEALLADMLPPVSQFQAPPITEAHMIDTYA